MIVISFFKWIAPIYDPMMNLIGYGKLLEQLVNKIEPASGEKLLDLAGGTGQLLKYIPEEVEVTLVDSSEKMLARAREKNDSQETEFILGQAEDLSLPDAEFDYTVVADALHHFNDVEGIIREVKRVLKPSGELYIIELNPESLIGKFVSYGESVLGEPVNFYRPEKLAFLIRKVGFHTEVEKISESFYILECDYI